MRSRRPSRDKSSFIAQAPVDVVPDLSAHCTRTMLILPIPAAASIRRHKGKKDRQMTSVSAEPEAPYPAICMHVTLK